VSAVIDQTDRLGEAVDALHTAQATALEARVLAHAINGYLAAIVGGLDLLAADPSLSAEHRREVAEMQQAASEMTAAFTRMHSLVRTIAPGPLSEPPPSW
jgi:hypothetical protein